MEFEKKRFDNATQLGNWISAYNDDNFDVIISKTEVVTTGAIYITGHMTPKPTVASLLKFAHDTIVHKNMDNDVASLVFSLAVTKQGWELTDVRDDIIAESTKYNMDFILSVLDTFGDTMTVEESKQYYQKKEKLTFKKVDPTTFFNH